MDSTDTMLKLTILISFYPALIISLSNGIRGIYEDSSGILWVGTGNGLYQFDRETEEFILIKLIKKKGERIANRFTTITEDNRWKYLVLCRSHL